MSVCHIKSPLYYVQDTMTDSEWFNNRQEICFHLRKQTRNLHLESAGSNPTGDRLIFTLCLEALISLPNTSRRKQTGS